MTSDHASGDGSGAYPRRSEKILWREADGAVVLFHEDDGRAFALDEAASAVWMLADGSRPTDAIVRELAAASGADEARVRADVSALLESLRAGGCVEFVPAGDGGRPEASAPPPIVPSAWHAPAFEEIRFGACDCTSAGRGVMRNAECSTTPKTLQSTV
jgi:hypothetical protein